MCKIDGILFFVVFCLIVLNNLSAQTNCNFKISGNVSDADTKEPLFYANILIFETGVSVYSDTNGYYVLKNICAGEYNLVISHFSCQPIRYKIKVGSNMLQNFVLPHKTNELREITVTDKHIPNKTSIKEELNAKNLFFTRGLSIGESLQNIVGVNTIQTGNNIFKPMINGLHGNRLQIIANGVRLESQQWGTDHAPEIDPFNADKITVIKGAGALRYGSDALAGTILTESKPLPIGGKINSELFTGFFSNNNMFVSHAMIEKNIKHFPALSWRLNVSGKIAGNTKTPNYFLWNSGMSEANASLTLGYRKPTFSIETHSSVFSTTLGIFLGSQIGNITDLQEAIKAPSPLFNKNEFSYKVDRPRQEINHITNKVKYTYYKDPRHLLNIQLAHQLNRRKEFDLSMISNKPELDLTLQTTQAEIWYEHRHDYWLHNYGTTSTFKENNWQGSRFFIPNYRNYQASAYHISAYTKNKFSAEAGIRYDFQHLTTYRNINNYISSNNNSWHNASSTINLKYVGINNFLYALNLSMAWRPPAINELFVNGLHHGTSSFEIGNTQMQSEKGYKIAFQITKPLFDSLVVIETFVFNNLILDIINLVPDTAPTLTIRGAFPTFRYIQTNANLSGVDFKIMLKPSAKVNHQITGSILYARDLNTETWLQQMPSNRLNQQFSYCFSDFKYFKNLQLQLQYLTVFKQTRLPENSTDYLPPPDTYNLLNAFLTTNYKNTQIQFGSNNILNTVYREYLNRFRYFNDEPGRNIFVRILINFNNV
ncbi:MAG: carboxypeptidase-like regulatory domain-containing protein [Bacteroidia bacterium]